MQSVDTSAEAVEAMVKELHFTVADLPTEIGCMAAAALLRALLRERDEAREAWRDWQTIGIDAQAALATARADALREAAAKCLTCRQHISKTQFAALMDANAAILALIQKEHRA